MTPAEVFGAFIGLLFNILLACIGIVAMQQLHPHGWLALGFGLLIGTPLFEATCHLGSILLAAARGRT